MLVDAAVAALRRSWSSALPSRIACEHRRGQCLRVAVELAGRLAVLRCSSSKRAVAQELRRELHHLGVARIEEHDPAFGIEHAQALRHVVERRVERSFCSRSCCSALRRSVMSSWQDTQRPSGSGRL